MASHTDMWGKPIVLEKELVSLLKKVPMETLEVVWCSNLEEGEYILSISPKWGDITIPGFTKECFMFQTRHTNRIVRDTFFELSGIIKQVPYEIVYIAMQFLQLGELKDRPVEYRKLASSQLQNIQVPQLVSQLIQARKARILTLIQSSIDILSEEELLHNYRMGNINKSMEIKHPGYLRSCRREITLDEYTKMEIELQNSNIDTEHLKAAVRAVTLTAADLI